MKRAIVGLLGALGAIYAGVAWYFSSQIVAFETKTLDGHQAELGLTLEGLGLGEPVDVDVSSSVGSVRGWLFPGADDARCAVILHHGHGANRWGGLEYAPLFQGRGCDLLAYDARYHGESDGAYGTYGYHEREDALAVIGWLAAERDLPLDQIGLFGESMGASIALMTAAKAPELAFVAADASFSSLRTILTRQAGAQYGWLVQQLVPGALAVAAARADFEPDAVAPAAAAAEIRIPVYVGHSTTDTYTPPAHSEAIYAAVPHQRKALHLNEWGAEHCKDINARPGEYKAQIDAFLAAHAPGFGALAAAPVTEPAAAPAEADDAVTE